MINLALMVMFNIFELDLARTNRSEVEVCIDALMH